MRPRWHEWVIVTSIVVIGCVGILAIWGDDLLAMVRDVARDEPAVREEAPPAEQPAPPPGQLPPAAGTTI